MLDRAASVACAAEAAAMLAAEFGHDASWATAQVAAFTYLAARYWPKKLCHKIDPFAFLIFR